MSRYRGWPWKLYYFSEVFSEDRGTDETTDINQSSSFVRLIHTIDRLETLPSPILSHSRCRQPQEVVFAAMGAVPWTVLHGWKMERVYRRTCCTLPSKIISRNDGDTSNNIDSRRPFLLPPPLVGRLRPTLLQQTTLPLLVVVVVVETIVCFSTSRKNYRNRRL